MRQAEKDAQCYSRSSSKVSSKLQIMYADDTHCGPEIPMINVHCITKKFSGMLENYDSTFADGLYSLVEYFGGSFRVGYVGSTSDVPDSGVSAHPLYPPRVSRPTRCTRGGYNGCADTPESGTSDVLPTYPTRKLTQKYSTRSTFHYRWCQDALAHFWNTLTKRHTARAVECRANPSGSQFVLGQLIEERKGKETELLRRRTQPVWEYCYYLLAGESLCALTLWEYFPQANQILILMPVHVIQTEPNKVRYSNTVAESNHIKYQGFSFVIADSVKNIFAATGVLLIVFSSLKYHDPKVFHFLNGPPACIWSKSTQKVLESKRVFYTKIKCKEALTGKKFKFSDKKAKLVSAEVCFYHQLFGCVVKEITIDTDNEKTKKRKRNKAERSCSVGTFRCAGDGNIKKIVTLFDCYCIRNEHNQTTIAFRNKIINQFYCCRKFYGQNES